jgi:hypothetical protein
MHTKYRQQHCNALRPKTVHLGGIRTRDLLFAMTIMLRYQGHY